MTLEAKLGLNDHRLRVVSPPSGLSLPSRPGPGSQEALLVFVRDAAQLELRAEEVSASALADRLTWVAYPKAGQLGTDLNRDRLAELLGSKGVRPVRQIALDDVWSALRFRPGSR